MSRIGTHNVSGDRYQGVGHKSYMPIQIASSKVTCPYR